MSLSMFSHLISVVRLTDIPETEDQLFRETKGHLLVTRSVTCIVQQENQLFAVTDSG